MSCESFTGLSFQLRISCVMGGGNYDDVSNTHHLPRTPRAKYRNMIERIFGIELYKLIQAGKVNRERGDEFIKIRCRLDQFAMFIVERNSLFLKESHTHRNQIRELNMQYITLPPLRAIEVFETHHFIRNKPYDA